MKKNSKEKQPGEVLAVRVPLPLFEAVKTAAAADGRSLASYLRKLLSDTLSNPSVENQNKDK